MELTNDDKTQLQEKGISNEKLFYQLNRFENGFSFLEIAAPATVEKGIRVIPKNEMSRYLDEWQAYRQQNKQIVKFVPASGAASRMFKDLFSFLETSSNVPTTDFEKTFFSRIKEFAFYESLNAICLNSHKKDINALLAAGEYKTIVRNLLEQEGLDYGFLPKGLLKFHRYGSLSCTPVEEHMKEGALYAKTEKGVVNIHFTVSKEHRSLFESLIGERKKEIGEELGVNFNVSLSEQKPETDTVAAGADNQPFREEGGKMVFRPGGHGALIENLNDLDADVIFIKNIDNVVQDRYKEQEATYKALLAGVLVNVQNKAFEYLRLIDSGKYNHDELKEILHFLQDTLNVKNPETKLLEDVELVLYLKRKLDRPFRVCGMVRNTGEPGGGPFLAVNQDKTVSPQILESSQIDMENPAKKEMFLNGTHFNPVDLVCGVKDYRGHHFDLRNYVDPHTGFISIKSKGGKELKALELPGLWNGAMSDWNTIFVEVPITTFNPVKTVNDLLREHHLEGI